MKHLQQVHFLEYGELRSVFDDDLPPGAEEDYALDYWFEFEDTCLACTHQGGTRFSRCEAPPANAKPIPISPDAMVTSCMNEALLGSSLSGIVAAGEGGYILRLAEGGLIELEADCSLMGDGPSLSYLRPHFYSPDWLAAPENASTRAWLDEELAHNQAVAVQDAPPPAETTPAPSPTGPPPWEQLPRAQATDFVNDVAPREQSWLNKKLWENEWVCWATRPQAPLWDAHVTTEAVVGALLLAGTVVFCALAALHPQHGTGLWLNPSSSFTANLVLSTLPLWGFALFLLLTPWRRRHRLRHTLYVITNTRAIVLRCGLLPHEPQWWLLTPKHCYLCEQGTGEQGHLIFSTYDLSREDLSPQNRQGFLHLSNLSRAHKELRTVIAANRHRS